METEISRILNILALQKKKLDFCCKSSLRQILLRSTAVFGQNVCKTQFLIDVCF